MSVWNFWFFVKNYCIRFFYYVLPFNDSVALWYEQSGYFEGSNYPFSLDNYTNYRFVPDKYSDSYKYGFFRGLQYANDDNFLKNEVRKLYKV